MANSWRCYGGMATIDDSTFSENGGDGHGAIFNSGTLTVNRSVFSDNTSSFGAGAIANDGTLTVKDCIFSDNVGLDGPSGSLHNFGTLTIDNSTFSGNRTASGGGGLANGGMATINNSTFSDNHDSGDPSPCTKAEREVTPAPRPLVPKGGSHGDRGSRPGTGQTVGCAARMTCVSVWAAVAERK